ncbi:hypothetical protein Tco_0864047 [Tanacetum coccineum]
MWGVGFRIVKGLEGCGEVNEVDNDRRWGYEHWREKHVEDIQYFKSMGEVWGFVKTSPSWKCIHPLYDFHNAEKAEEVKDDIKKAKLPPSGSSLFVSSGFGNQFLNLSSDTSLIALSPHTYTQNSFSSSCNTLLHLASVFTISPVLLQTTTSIPTPPITIEAPPVTTIPDPLHAIIQRVSVLEKDVQELKEVDHTTTLCTLLRSEIPFAINAYLGSSLGDALQKSVQANLINEVKNQLPKFLPKAVSDFATPVIQSTVKNALEKTLLVLAQSSSQAQSSLQAAKSLSEYELKMILFEKIDNSCSYLTHDKHQALFDALLNSMSLDDAIARGQADLEKVLRKRDHDDEDPSAGPNQDKMTKRRRTKEFEPSKKSSTTKESSKGKSPVKTSKSGKSVTVEELVEEPVFEMASDDIEQTIDDVVNDVDQPPNDTTQTKDKVPKYDWFKQPPRPPTPNPEWNKRQVVDNQPKQPWFNNMMSTVKDLLTFHELMATPIDFSKYAMNGLKIDNLTQAHLVGPVYELLKGTCKSRPGRLTVAAEYFFNNDLEFLKSSDPEKKYTTSITKTKAARYEIVRIEDMVPKLWSAAKVGYDKDTLKGIKYWDDKSQLWYRSQINKSSKHKVYSTQKILSAINVKVQKLHGYGHLEEIMVRRADRQKYTFKEGDFVDLHLNDIEDMLLLVVQHKLFQLKGSDIVEFIVDLRMFTRSLIIKRRVEDLQLGVESYQKKLNLTKPQNTFPGIEFKEPYTPSFKPPGEIYEDLNKQKRVMRADELYKFSDETLKTVRDELL